MVARIKAPSALGAGGLAQWWSVCLPSTRKALGLSAKITKKKGNTQQ